MALRVSAVWGALSSLHSPSTRALRWIPLTPSLPTMRPGDSAPTASSSTTTVTHS
nr:MAG TPA: hypothetical protein [Caudoviricetes sp.]